MIRLGLSGVTALFFLLAASCSLVKHNQRIVSPPGCSRCHLEPVAGNWHVLFKPAIIHDETGSEKVNYNTYGKPPRDGNWRRCFSCHHVPATDHALYRGVYDH